MSDSGNGRKRPRPDGDEGGWVRERKLCPYVSEPRRECYCYNLISQNVMEAIMYCGGSYVQCDVYKGFVRGEEKERTHRGPKTTIPYDRKETQ